MGNDEIEKRVSSALRALGFDAHVFKKNSQSRPTKAVDISLATEILSLGYRDAYDIVCLVAGDRDYVPLVREVKRMGKQVYVSFFSRSSEAGLSEELQQEADLFLDRSSLFDNRARQYAD